MKEKNNIEKLEKFFTSDTRIKESMFSLALNEMDGYNLEYTVKYVDKVYKELKYIEEELLEIVTDFKFGDSVLERIKKVFKAYKESLMNCDHKIEKLKNFYKVCISSMNIELINDISKECAGYYFGRDINPLMNRCTTINEILHLFHSYICSDERMYQSMNKISEKNSLYNYSITLYGNESDLATRIFNSFPIDIEWGCTDIVSLKRNEKILMMIRDKGHALTIEITKELNNIKVSYAIPKLCNIEKINNLRGVRKVDLNRDILSGTTGSFTTTEENIIFDLFDFISKVPTDADIEIFKNWK